VLNEKEDYSQYDLPAYSHEYLVEFGGSNERIPRSPEPGYCRHYHEGEACAKRIMFDLAPRESGIDYLSWRAGIRQRSAFGHFLS
jgi:hypothetical protein